LNNLICNYLKNIMRKHNISRIETKNIIIIFGLDVIHRTDFNEIFSQITLILSFLINLNKKSIDNYGENLEFVTATYKQRN
jgi:hypothetical protein